MATVLLLFAHPRLERSRSNLALMKHVPKNREIYFHDLYERYPDFNIDVRHEQELLLQHDILIWHHPFYWYSAPPLLKQWIDMVLEYGWAYGHEGTKLAGKLCFNTITTGGNNEAYSEEGYNRFSIRNFLLPFDQTATLCRMRYLPPFVVQGTHRLSDAELDERGKQYGILLNRLAFDDFDLKSVQQLGFLNEIAEGIKE
jgi:glutathione-regulated potassium-efflux system ancillary protein KefG